MKNKNLLIAIIILVALLYMFERAYQLKKTALDNERLKIETEAQKFLAEATLNLNPIETFKEEIQPRTPIGYKIPEKEKI